MKEGSVTIGAEQYGPLRHYRRRPGIRAGASAEGFRYFSSLPRREAAEAMARRRQLHG